MTLELWNNVRSFSRILAQHRQFASGIKKKKIRSFYIDETDKMKQKLACLQCFITHKTDKHKLTQIYLHIWGNFSVFILPSLFIHYLSLYFFFSLSHRYCPFLSHSLQFVVGLSSLLPSPPSPSPFPPFTSLPLLLEKTHKDPRAPAPHSDGRKKILQ